MVSNTPKGEEIRKYFIDFENQAKELMQQHIDATKELMDTLATEHKFVLTEEEKNAIQEDFSASFSDDSACEEVIGKYAKKGYIMDPHTATCMGAYESLREKSIPTVVYSTAEWTKFSPAVAKALGKDVKGDIEALQWVSEHANVPVPNMINALFEKPVKHKIVVEKSDIRQEMLNFI